MLLALKGCVYTASSDLTVSLKCERPEYKFCFQKQKKRHNRFHVRFILKTVAKDLCHTGEKEMPNQLLA